MSTDRGTRSVRPNLVLIAKREQKGWHSRRRAARELHRIWTASLPHAPDLESLEKALYRHETGRTQVRDEAYRKLYCLAYDASPHELFGYLGPEEEAADHDGFKVRSHKLITGYIGAKLVEQLRRESPLQPARDQWFDCERVDYPSPDGDCTLYLWPFGSAIFHLVEDLTMPSLATLAVWRYQSYRENLEWATNELRRVLRDPSPSASYVLSAYWVQKSIWSIDTLDTALRILCMPKSLLDRNAYTVEALDHATLVERSLLDQGFGHPGLHPFGVKGISIGYAAWSGVVYFPLAERRCLTEEELVAAELAAQALWTYCDFINGQVEQGQDPDVPAEFGWRFLRAMRSRLTNPRPQEIEQHWSLRNAILETSGIKTLLAHAIETLRETEGRS